MIAPFAVALTACVLSAGAVLYVEPALAAPAIDTAQRGAIGAFVTTPTAEALVTGRADMVSVRPAATSRPLDRPDVLGAAPALRCTIHVVPVAWQGSPAVSLDEIRGPVNAAAQYWADVIPGRISFTSISYADALRVPAPGGGCSEAAGSMERAVEKQLGERYTSGIQEHLVIVHPRRDGCYAGFASVWNTTVWINAAADGGV
ncbi:hypothetical protein BJY21_003084 [Kineosphaera limosa]|uniref:Uncharacterized protein n=1 Tax=Kineosphaera limosa NBRC 100340 TaxID=1184609 RepID=K6WVJ1_9MICO|nr:hypothetical protein [Kineosphaera limosa]NYE01900.1 hypothetical protein [Kineosphaera limosa]GAB96127.1 hypothetical protein KILIM_032_00120 [Kineosphaera limosa NBRC 100340]